MKTLLSILFTLSYILSFGQSTLILPLGAEYYKIQNTEGKGLFINSDMQSMGTYINPTSGWIQTHSDQIMRVNGGAASFRIETDCNVQYNFPYKLGSDAPAIRNSVFTGNTASTQGGLTNITPSGLNFSNILSMNLIVNCGPAGYVPYNYTYTSGYQVDFFTSNTNIIIRNIGGNSANILNKSFKLYVTYSN